MLYGKQNIVSMPRVTGCTDEKDLTWNKKQSVCFLYGQEEYYRRFGTAFLGREALFFCSYSYSRVVIDTCETYF